jgi:hypothetical protein
LYLPPRFCHWHDVISLCFLACGLKKDVHDEASQNVLLQCGFGLQLILSLVLFVLTFHYFKLANGAMTMTVSSEDIEFRTNA